jgi:hypothetical protein
MRKPRPSYFFPMLILILILPTAASLFYVRVTGDQTMRPLGITIAHFANNLINGTTRGVVAQVQWGASAKSASSKKQVKQALNTALSVYQFEHRVKINSVPGTKIQVFYLVENSRIGPYRLSNMSSGIPAALSAHRAMSASN